LTTVVGRDLFKQAFVALKAMPLPDYMIASLGENADDLVSEENFGLCLVCGC